jgi:polar amino acid transport system permease protein
MATVVIPQAFRIILPPLTNELIMLTKDSSLIYLIGVQYEQLELTKFGRDAMNQYRGMTPILIAGALYLIITLPLGYLSRRLERHTGGKKVS